MNARRDVMSFILGCGAGDDKWPIVFDAVGLQVVDVSDLAVAGGMW
jgi:hypothetical protein